MAQDHWGHETGQVLGKDQILKRFTAHDMTRHDTGDVLEEAFPP